MEHKPYKYQLDTDGDDLIMTIDWRYTSHYKDGIRFDLLHENILIRLIMTLKEQPTVSSIVIKDTKLYHLVSGMMTFLKKLLELDTLLERCAGNDPMSPAIPDGSTPQLKCGKCTLKPAAIFNSMRDNLSQQFSADSNTVKGTPLLISENLNSLSHHMDNSPYCQRCRGKTHEEMMNIFNEMVDLETFSRKEALFIVSDSRKIRL